MRKQLVSHSNEGAQPFLTLEEVALRVGGNTLFAGLNWTIRADQQWALIGPNGAGKSTLAKALCHEVDVVRGRIRYFFDEVGSPARPYFKRGEIVKISPEAQRSLLQAHDSYYQARWQSFEGQAAATVAELLTGESLERVNPYDVTPLKVAPAVYQARRERALALLGIGYLLERKIVHVSNGEAQKVLLARALMQAPKLLILDDPFRGLDTRSREVLQRVLADLMAAGQPRLLLITPRSEELPAGITHVLEVAAGRMVAQGRKPSSPPTATPPTAGATSALRCNGSAFPFPENAPPPGDRPTLLLELQSTSVSYQGVNVLHGINWIVRPGENWAVLGPNGAGKTTLLSLILADNPQGYGNAITLFGRRRGSGESIWEIKRRIGWVSPELQLYYQRDLACQQVVCAGFFDSIGVYQAYTPAQAAAARQWLAAFGAAHLADRPFGAASVGEQRLVLLARALVKHPSLLILDEPCQGLDADNRRCLLTLLDALCASMAVNLIYVTHHFAEMPNAITHVLHLERGRIQASGTRRQVLGW